MCSVNGLAVASETAKRWTITCLHSAADEKDEDDKPVPPSELTHRKWLVRRWSGKESTTARAHAYLSNSDVEVTNNQDRDDLLPKIQVLDKLVKEAFEKRPHVRRERLHPRLEGDQAEEAQIRQAAALARQSSVYTIFNAESLRFMDAWLVAATCVATCRLFALYVALWVAAILVGTAVYDMLLEPYDYSSHNYLTFYDAQWGGLAACVTWVLLATIRRWHSMKAQGVSYVAFGCGILCWIVFHLLLGLALWGWVCTISSA